MNNGLRALAGLALVVCAPPARNDPAGIAARAVRGCLVSGVPGETSLVTGICVNGNDCVTTGNVVDLGLVAYPVRDSKLEIFQLRKDPLVLICHPQNPLAKQKSIRLKGINGQKFIGFEPDIPTRRAIDRILKEHSVQVNHVMEFDNIETVKRAVEIDAGVAIVPQGTVVQEVAKQTLAAVALDDGDFHRPLAAIYKRNKALTPAIKQFLAMLKEEKASA